MAGEYAASCTECKRFSVLKPERGKYSQYDRVDNGLIQDGYNRYCDIFVVLKYKWYYFDKL